MCTRTHMHAHAHCTCTHGHRGTQSRYTGRIWPGVYVCACVFSKEHTHKNTILTLTPMRKLPLIHQDKSVPPGRMSLI